MKKILWLHRDGYLLGKSKKSRREQGRTGQY